MTDYENHWKDWRSDGPGDWRRSHHGTPDAEFATLCQDAERVGARVGIDVANRVRKTPDGDAFRELGPVVVVDRKGREIIRAHMTQGRSLRAASVLARKALEAA